MKKKVIHNYWLIAVLVLFFCLLFLPWFQIMARADGLESSMPITTDGTNYMGILTEEVGANYYRFTLESSGKIDLSAIAEMEYISYYIYDESGNQLWDANLTWNDTTKRITSYDTIDLVKGNYYFVVRKRAYYERTGNYSFKLNFTSAGESFVDTQYSEQSNDSLDTASNIALNTEYKGQLALNDSRDFYRFTLESTGRIILSSIAEMRYISYCIYDESGNQLWDVSLQWNDTTKRITSYDALDLVKGTYYFVVRKRDYYERTGNYSFKLDFTSAEETFVDSNNSLDTASPIAFYTEYKGQLALNDSKDFYRFSLDSAERIRLIAEIGLKRMYFCIYNEVGNLVWSELYYWNDVTKKASVDKTIDLEAGVYYLVAEQQKYYEYTGNYSFQFTKYVETPVISTLSNLNSGIRLEWESSIGADGYQIYRKTGSGKWKRVKTTKDSSWTDKKAVENGTRYQYRIYAYSGTVKSNWSEIKTIYRLTAPTLSSVKSNSNYSLTAKWKKNGKASGYEVWYKPQENTDYWYVDVPGKNTGSRAINGLYSEKYDVCVRSYKTVKGVKYYSAVSKAKRVKIKK